MQFGGADVELVVFADTVEVITDIQVSGPLWTVLGQRDRGICGKAEGASEDDFFTQKPRIGKFGVDIYILTLKKVRVY